MTLIPSKQLVPSSAIDINTLTSSLLDPTGLTSNIAQFQSLAAVLGSVGRDMPTPVNFGVGSPTVLSINPTVASGGVLADPAIHYLKPNQSFFFLPDPGVVLPPQVSFNTPYYVTSANLLSTTFTFSAVNNYGVVPGIIPQVTTTEGAPVNTTGTVTGTPRIVFTGRDVAIFIPPGTYFGGNFNDNSIPSVNVTPNGIQRIRYYAEGAVFDTKVNFSTSGSQGMSDSKTWQSQTFDYVNTTPNFVNPGLLDATVQLQTIANAARYYVGQLVAFFGFDLQNPLGLLTSGPPNNQFHEFKRIVAINLSLGQITFDGPLKWVYLSTFPNMFNVTGQIGGGAALIAGMHPIWDTDIEVHGARWFGQPPASQSRRFLWNECTFQGYGNYPGQAAPSVAQSYIYRKCRFGPGDGPGVSYMEVDKMLENLEVDDCETPNHYTILFPSPSVQVATIRKLKGAQIGGTPRHLRLTDSIVEMMQVGPYIGQTDILEIDNTHLGFIQILGRNDDPEYIAPGNDMTLVPNWSFNDGVFTRNITGLPGKQGMDWEAPGIKVFFVDAGGAFGPYQNMGSPFAILNSYMDGSGNFSFGTTLRAIPTRQTSSVVSISAGVVTWNAHGFPAGTCIVLTTTGVLQTGYSTSTLYYIVNPTTNTFQLATSRGGTPIITSGTQSGTHTAWANPLAFRPHPCTGLTVHGSVTGHPNVLDMIGAVNEPFFSRIRGRSFVGILNPTTLAGEFSNYQQPNPIIWGFLNNLIVNVVQPATSGSITISSPGFIQGFPASLALSNFSQTIDLTRAGKRIITNTAVTGNVGTDALVPYADWLAGPVVFSWSGTPTSIAASAIGSIEMYSDQSITAYNNMMGAPNNPALANSYLWQWMRAGIVQQYGSFP